MTRCLRHDVTFVSTLNLTRKRSVNLSHESISNVRNEYRALYDDVGSDVVSLWPTLSQPVRIAMTATAVEALQFDAEVSSSLMVAAPELFGDDDDENGGATNEAALGNSPPIVAVDADGASALGRLLLALRNGGELESSLWPPALDFEADMALLHGAAAARDAFGNLKLLRSFALLNVATNLLLIRIDDGDDDGGGGGGDVDDEIADEAQR